MLWKRTGVLAGAAMMMLALAGCGSTSSEGLSSATATEQQTSSVLAQSTAVVVSGSGSSAVYEGPSELAMYENIEDIPGPHKYGFDEDGYITQDGESWLATPGGGPNYYTNPVFADENHLFVRCVWEGENDFQWYYYGWVRGVDDYGVIPDSKDVMFTGTSGTLLLCEDGRTFDAETMEWVEPGQ